MTGTSRDSSDSGGASFEVVQTRAGHHAMLDRSSGEVMHPLLGPRAESEMLYVGPAGIRERLRLRQEPQLHELAAAPLAVLDVGLGAGSNACATLRAAAALSAPRRPLELVSLDRTLAAIALASSDAHAADFGFDPMTRQAAHALIRAGQWRAPDLHWRVVVGDLPATLQSLPRHGFDVVYWDPFSPAQNGELWTLATFQGLHDLCRSGATVHTYSGATAVRSALLLAGFFVGLGIALPRGRQATVASTSLDALQQPLGPRFIARLSRSSAPLPVDAPADALERLARHPQFSRQPPK